MEVKFRFDLGTRIEHLGVVGVVDGLYLTRGGEKQIRFQYADKTGCIGELWLQEDVVDFADRVPEK